MGNIIIGKLLRFVGRRLDGYKTTIGGVGMILSGLAGLIGYMFPDQPDLPHMDIEQALLTISGGFAVLGLGGKAEKVKAAVSGNTPTRGGDH
ncbi:MAG: hypothetical protein WC383_17125 [Gammaproteobacteria bacterium]|jgi:hypothetical protein